MWNNKQRRFQNHVALHVIRTLPDGAVFRSADGTQVYCHPSKETEVKSVMHSLFTDLDFTSTLTYPKVLKIIMGKYPHA